MFKGLKRLKELKHLPLWTQLIFTQRDSLCGRIICETTACSCLIVYQSLPFPHEERHCPGQTWAEPAGGVDCINSTEETTCFSLLHSDSTGVGSLHQKLSVLALPVYIVVNVTFHSDIFFLQFFASLKIKEMEQVWGNSPCSMSVKLLF